MDNKLLIEEILRMQRIASIVTENESKKVEEISMQQLDSKNIKPTIS